MALFKKKPLMCPACDREITEPRMTHWLGHTYIIDEGEGAGSYTWRCKCGLAPMYWAKDTQAASGMAIPMRDRHMIPIS
jgi:hypothetical protein